MSLRLTTDEDPATISNPQEHCHETDHKEFEAEVVELDNVFEYPPLKTPKALPGDCDVKSFVLENYKPYTEDASFLAEPTERTLRALQRCEELMEVEQQKGILDVDEETPSTITSHGPGYLLSKEEDVIVGLQTDEPLKRSCKPRGGFRVVKAALKSYGYSPDETMEATYGPHGPVETHNDLVFSIYSEETCKARHAHLLTGLPDAYGRGRIIGDYRRVALFGVTDLIERKQKDYNTVTGSLESAMRLRSEISKQIKALRELLKMALSYGVDLREPAKTFKQAAQAMWIAHVAALKDQDGAAMSIGRWYVSLSVNLQPRVTR
jgi:formate C-acetyltransferase